MRERHIFWDIAVVGLLLALVILNSLTLLQNQSIETRLIKNMEAIASSRGSFRSAEPERTSTQPTVAQSDIKHSPSYFDGSTNPKFVRGDEKADDGDTLTINELSAPNSLNPLIDNDANTTDMFNLGNEYLAVRSFDDPNVWEPRLASGWEKAMVCRGVAAKKNAKELAEKLNQALSPDARTKLKITKIDAESDDILRVELFDTKGDYRDAIAKALGETAIEQQHWIYISFDGTKFTDGTPITAAATAERVRAAIQKSPDFKGRFLADWERETSVVIRLLGDSAVAENAVKAFMATDANKGEVVDPKSATGKSIKSVLTFDGSEHYVFEEKPVYTFFLRNDVKWHDGRPFTGKDVVFSFDTMMNPKVECAPSRNFYQDCASVKLVDNNPYIVQFIWNKPFFLSFATSCEMYLFPEHIFHFTDAKEFNENPKNQGIVGTGPYRLESHDPKHEVVFVRSDDYVGPKAHFKKIVCKFISDRTVSLELLKKGDLDAHYLTKAQAKLAVEDEAFKKKFNIEQSIDNSYNYLGWNIRRDMFNSTKTRQALTMLIDRKRICETIYRGFAVQLDVPAHPQSSTYPTNAAELRIPFDIQAAKQLLKEDGWADTDGDNVLDKVINGKKVPFKFTLLFPSGKPEYEGIANQIKEAFAQAGIDVNLRNLEWSVFIQNVERLNFDAMLLGWRLTVSSDPFQLWHSSQVGEKASNHCGYINKQVDQWIEEGRKELDEPKRNALFQRVFEQVAKDQPYTFLLVQKRTIAHDNRIRNNVYNIMDRDLTRWWVPKEMQKVK
ncbi:MAG: ABC transporter substrate-binding protein [Planctomycetota bacterium]